MGKYNLGKRKSAVNEKITKDNLFVDEARAQKLTGNIDKNLELIEKSLLSIDKLLMKAVNTGDIKGSRIKVFKSWSRKCKSQANSAEKLRGKMKESYEKDVRLYPVKVLDDKIADLEKKIALLEGKEG